MKNTQVGLPLVNNVINPVYGGGAIVYNGVLSALDGNPLPPLVVADSSFIKNEAFGPGGAIISYEVPIVDLEGRVRFIRNVSQQSPDLNDVAVVVDSLDLITDGMPVFGEEVSTVMLWLMDNGSIGEAEFW